MTAKERFQSWIYNKDKQLREQETAMRASFLNKRYHSFFEGYTEVQVKKPNGKTRIERVYTGKFYRQNLSTLAYVGVRISYLILWAICAVLYLSTGLHSYSFNLKWFCVLPQVGALPCLFYTTILLIDYVFAERKLKIYDYKQCHKKLMKISLLGSMFFALAFLVSTIYVAAAGFSDEQLATIKYLICALSVFAINRIENTIEYEMLSPENDEISDGIEIHMNR